MNAIYTQSNNARFGFISSAWLAWTFVGTGVAIVPVFPPATSHLPFDGLIQLKWAFVLLCRFIPLRSSCVPLAIGNARFRDTIVCRNVDLLAS